MERCDDTTWTMPQMARPLRSGYGGNHTEQPKRTSAAEQGHQPADSRHAKAVTAFVVHRIALAHQLRPGGGYASKAGVDIVIGRAR